MAHRLLWNPMEFIDERKKNVFKHDGYWFTIGNSLILATTMAFLFIVYNKFVINAILWKTIGTYFLVFLAVSLLGHFFVAYLLYEILLFVNKKLDYFKALAVVGYSAFTAIASFALTVVFLSLSYVRVFAPFIGILLLLRSYGIFLDF